MKLLLDTHRCLWFIDGNPRLSATARALIGDLANERLVRIASLTGGSPAEDGASGDRRQLSFAVSRVVFEYTG